MALDNTSPKDNPVANEVHTLPTPSLPELVEPDHMDKVLRYLLRRGLFVAILLDVIYQSLWLMREYVRIGRGQPQPDSPFTVTSRLRWLVPVKITLTVNDGKAILSIPLWAWLQKLSRRRAIDLGDLLAEERPGKIRIFLRAASAFAIFISLPRYLLTALFQSMSATLRATARSIPYLTGLLIIMFITRDAWGLFGGEPPWRFAMLILLIVGVSMLVLIVGLRRWMSQDGWEGILGYPADEGAEVLARWRAKTPAMKLIKDGVRPEFPLVPKANNLVSQFWLLLLTANVSILLFVSIIADVLVVALWMSVAFVSVGIIAVSESMTRTLTGKSAIIIWHLNILGQTFVLTRQLVFLSIVLGGIAALTFSAAALQDVSSRCTFTEYAFVDLQRALSALACYLAVILGFLKEVEGTGVFARLRQSDNPSLKSFLDTISPLRTSLERIFARRSNIPNPASS